MARSKPWTSRPPADPPSLQEAVTQLTEQVKELTGQVEVLRNAIDEIREEFQWAIRNDKLISRNGNELPPEVHGTSMVRSTLAEDVNSVLPADPLPIDPPSSPVPPAAPGELF